MIYLLEYNKMPNLTTKQQMSVKVALPFLKIRSKIFKNFMSKQNLY